MKKVIYLNLFIDNEWDEKKIIDQIFNLTLSSSEEILKSYTLLGLFLSGEGDIVLVESSIDDDFLNYLEGHLGPLGTPVLLKEKIAINDDKDIILAGVSQKEEALFGKELLSKKGMLLHDSFAYLNKKDFLMNLAGKEDLKFPNSQIVKLKRLISDSPDKSYCLKFLNSAGGRGVFKITPGNNVLNFIEQQIEEQDSRDLMVMKQELIDIRDHFYTVAHTDVSLPVLGFNIEYDEKGNSKRHCFTGTAPEARNECAKKIASILRAQDYEGSFGFDGFTSLDGEIYPAIDLNVRIDKSRVFADIIGRLSDLSRWKNIEFRRERTLMKGSSCFKDFYEEKIKKMDHHNYKIIVLLCSNLFYENTEIRVAELTFILLSNTTLPDREYDSWVKHCYKTLGIE